MASLEVGNREQREVESQIGAKDDYIFFVHSARRPSVELCILVGSSMNSRVEGSSKEITID